MVCTYMPSLETLSTVSALPVTAKKILRSLLSALGSTYPHRLVNIVLLGTLAPLYRAEFYCFISSSNTAQRRCIAPGAASRA
jgi:hypothetical protein